MEEDDCIPFDLFSHLTEVRLLNTVLAITVGIYGSSILCQALCSALLFVLIHLILPAT